MNWSAYLVYLIVSMTIQRPVLVLKAIFVTKNYEIIDYNYNWSQLAFLEAFYIRNLKPSINEGLNASRDLDLFL